MDAMLQISYLQNFYFTIRYDPSASTAIPTARDTSKSLSLGVLVPGVFRIGDQILV
jgi:hypothetical protein